LSFSFPGALGRIVSTLHDGANERGTPVSKPRNDLTTPVPKFCLVLEASRRTTEGRVRTAHELVAHFFPHTEGGSTDRLFHFLPADVRGPMLTSWGVRGQKSALRDSDEKVRAVVHDALVAGDVDAPMFESSLAPEVLVRWIDLPDWWAFWRGGKLAKYSILKALETGYELGLFDADWFLITVGSKDGKTRGTDLLSEGLSKADLTEWLRAIYLTADGSPRGIVAALGWDQIVSKTPDDVLISVLDAIAAKVGLREQAKAKKAEEAVAAGVKAPSPEVAKAAPVEVAKAAPPEAKAAPPEAAKAAPPEAAKAPQAELPKAHVAESDEEAPRVPLETWTPAAPPVATEEEEEAEAPPNPANLKQPGVPVASPARAAEAPPAEARPAKDLSRAQPLPDAKPATRKLPAIFIPSSARMNDPPADVRPSQAAAPALTRDSAPADEEIPISADAFDDLGEGQKPITPRPPEASSARKRPSKAPHGTKG
jgi:hypothetical protein